VSRNNVQKSAKIILNLRNRHKNLIGQFHLKFGLSSKKSKRSKTGVTNLFGTEGYFLVQVHAKDYQFDTHSSEINICPICLQLLCIIIFEDIHQCEDTDHVYVIFRTRPWVTHMVRSGDQVPACTTLVTPGLRKGQKL